jgi:hypothetical protein
VGKNGAVTEMGVKQMTKHTPGPWEAKETPHSSNQNFVVLDCAKPRNKRICAVYSDNEAADARLIAAAPDMLAMLEYLDRKGGLGMDIHESLRVIINKATA